jgi:hypothetical protein
MESKDLCCECPPVETVRFVVGPFAWTPPSPWECLRCGETVITRLAAPRCPLCGFVEGT